MPRAVKVYGGNWGGTHRMVGAFTSLKDFMRLSGISRDFVSETGNKEELAIAHTAPGTLFFRSFMAAPDVPWQRRNNPTTPDTPA